MRAFCGIYPYVAGAAGMAEMPDSVQKSLLGCCFVELAIGNLLLITFSHAAGDFDNVLQVLLPLVRQCFAMKNVAVILVFDLSCRQLQHASRIVKLEIEECAARSGSAGIRKWITQ